jgi:hypothetical protein
VVSCLGEPVGLLMPQWLRNSIDEKADSNTSAVVMKETKIIKVSNHGTNRSSKDSSSDVLTQISWKRRPR